MSPARAARLALALALVSYASSSGAGDLLPLIGDARLEPLAFHELPGWGQEDHEAALETFRRSCAAILEHRDTLRSALPASEALRHACRTAQGAVRGGATAFFEQGFEPFEVVPPAGRGFLTGYFEPEYEGSLSPSDEFRVPLLGRPDDLITVPLGESWPGLEGLQAGRRTAAGYEPYAERAAIEDGALGVLAKPVVFVRDPVDAMIIQVQGSSRIRLPDGKTVRIAYAGKNGHPFTAVGRIVVERGHIPLAEINLARMTDWLKNNPVEAREIMRLNRSYVFFRLVDGLEPTDGPIGGAGVPLTAGRSLAVDRNLWSYGLPFWLGGDWPGVDGGPEPLARLTVAQDTGSAILGPARGDFFFGSGAVAGTRAGILRHRVRFVVLLPKAP